MSYQVLARKWRPKNFQELVGQEHVSRVLINGLDNERLHHAFLFAGTRGVGKTTIARILAKSLNCDTGVTAKPCGECSACLEVGDGRFVDLIEVDAASRTKVEDTRELLENVHYAPARGRYKVYLIDEVHMLSGHSFNALLKTLEEPPPHVKFLLATTDPQKLPITVLSRCLQFNLKKLSLDDIAAHLAHILQQEKIEYDDAALRQIARGAQGSMRDALSLLDQAIAFGGGRVGDEDVRSMLGVLETAHVYQLITQMHEQDAKAVLSTIDAIDHRGPDYLDILAEMISIYHHIAMEQQVAGSMTDEWDDPQKIQQFAKDISPMDVQLYYQVALQGRNDLKISPYPREGFEMTLLRMIAFRPWRRDKDAQPDAAGSRATAPNKVATPSQSAAITQPVDKATAAPQKGASNDWHDIVAALGLKALSRQIAENCQIEVFENDAVNLVLDQSYAALLNDNGLKDITSALNDYFGKPLKVKIQPGVVPSETPAQRKKKRNEERQQSAIASIENDENILMMKKEFGATILADAIQPVEK